MANEPVATTGFDFDEIDVRNGWTEDDESLPSNPTSEQHAQNGNHCKQAASVSTTNTDPFNVDLTPVAPKSEAVIKLLSLLLAANDVKAELLVICSAFGMGALLGGQSFTELAVSSGITKQAFSKRVIRMQKIFNLPVCRSQKCVAARESYRKAQLLAWQKTERQLPDMRQVRHFLGPDEKTTQTQSTPRVGHGPDGKFLKGHSHGA